MFFPLQKNKKEDHNKSLCLDACFVQNLTKGILLKPLFLFEVHDHGPTNDDQKRP